MKLLASYFVWRASRCKDAGDVAGAIRNFSRAIAVAPRWTAPHYNLGLLRKYRGEWPESLAHNLEAMRLDPSHEAATWNAGIAATALGRWKEARSAWSSYGIDIPDGTGPIDMDLGLIPIRLDPDGNGEVVWCRRIDPARAVVLSIPLPESGRACGDTLLHDGAPVGYRMLADQEVPVFNELALLNPSRLSTFGVDIEFHRDDDRSAFEQACEDAAISFEDWTTSVRIICRDCSEGRPHQHAQEDRPEEPRPLAHAFGIAAATPEQVERVLRNWRSRHSHCRVGELEVLLSPDSREFEQTPSG